ncbi:hypothetical protein GCM10010495_41940 [Kitasatospora herbaricolor]|uniref:prepilin peptidase n=1 Tax=Kitasatospora herbaricolor TaxID=68217 RepID=UPI00199B7B96|nr:prepilin peptidase [Kitasatospora herbaricolor]MDQ0310354.1 leader peptidase (prepilin peptidase)/N-methyltransferase [Kitasatospora herbaricolor]GGV21894.1 hypothetical protein GCM10010495_41940 [Kitasatospora herbaricolor]
MAVIGPVLGAVAGLAAAPLLRAVVVRHAVPTAEEPLRTACPACGRPVAALAPTGRCRGCGGRLGPGAGQVELAAAGAAALVLAAAAPAEGLLLLWAVLCGVPLGFVDGAVRRLPDRVTGCLGAGVALLLVPAAFADGHPGVLLRCLLVALVAGALFELPAWFGQIGLGDAKLALGLGALLGFYGWGPAFVALFLASALGALWGTGRAGVELVRRRPVRGLEIPYGPFMLLGTLGAVLLAQR